MHARETFEPRPKRIIAVGGGKGGVGKSLVAANLAVAIARRGLRTILVDADLGAANQHTLFGIDRLGPTVHGVLRHEVGRIEDALLTTSVNKLWLLPGTSSAAGAANPTLTEKERLLHGLVDLSADVLVLDVGAGISWDVVDLYTLADIRLSVILPQLTSAQNAYAFLKAAVLRVLEEAAFDETRTALLHTQLESRSAEKMPELLQRITAQDPELANSIRLHLQQFCARLVGNQIVDAKDRGIVQNLARMFQDFLGIDARVLGYVRFSRKLHDSVNARRPLLVTDPQDDSARTFDLITNDLLGEDVEQVRMGRHTADLPRIRAA